MRWWGYGLASLVVATSVVAGKHGWVIWGWQWWAFIGVVLAGWGLWRKRWQLVDACVVLVLSMILMQGSAGMNARDIDEGVLKSQFGKGLEGVVVDVPRQTNKSLQVQLGDLSSEAIDTNYSVMMYLPLHSQVAYGERLRVQGGYQSVSEVELASYGDFLGNKQIAGILVWPSIERVDSGHGWWLINWGHAVQRSAVDPVLRLLPQDLAAFCLGVVLGARLPVSDQFSEAMQVTGTSHLLVASGYNISLIVVATFSLVGWLPRWLVIGMTIFFMMGYVAVSGLDPSIIRACLMGSIGVVALLWGRQRLAMHGLFCAACVMLVVNPWWLFEVGFQLSYMATLGLIMFQGWLKEMYARRVGTWGSEVVCSTVAAQLLVWPVIGQTFMSVSLVSLLTNVLVLWLTPWLMLGGVGLIVLAWLSSEAAQWLAWGLYPWLQYVRQVIISTGRLPYALVEVGWSWLASGLYYGGLMLAIVARGRYSASR